MTQWAGLKGEWSRWFVIALLSLLLVYGTALANRNVYTKEQTETRVEQVQEIHNKDMEHLNSKMDRVEQQVDKLVDHLIDKDE
jgi:cell division protein FtsB